MNFEVLDTGIQTDFHLFLLQQSLNIVQLLSFFFKKKATVAENVQKAVTWPPSSTMHSLVSPHWSPSVYFWIWLSMCLLLLTAICLWAGLHRLLCVCVCTQKCVCFVSLLWACMKVDLSLTQLFFCRQQWGLELFHCCVEKKNSIHLLEIWQ